MKDVPGHRSKTAIRRNITIPKAIDDAMRRHPQVNWSAVAARAFEETLKKLRKGER